MSTKITYNSKTTEVANGKIATLSCNGKKMTTDVVIEVPTAIDSPLPIEVSTEAEMTALLTSGEVGGVYKYTGTTGTYENGALYVLEEEEEGYTVTLNIARDSSGEMTVYQDWNLFINGIFGAENDSIGSIDVPYLDLRIETNPIEGVTSIGISVVEQPTNINQFENFWYSIDGGEKKKYIENAFLPITSNCTITIYVPIYD